MDPKPLVVSQYIYVLVGRGVVNTQPVESKTETETQTKSLQ